MNVVCFIDNIYDLLSESTNLQTWADTTSLENHIFKFAIDTDYINSYPQVLVHNEFNVISYVNDRGFEWTNSVLIEFTDSPNRYFNDDDTKITKIGDLIRLFQLQVDGIIQEIACNPTIATMPIKNIKLIDMGVSSSEISATEAGRVLKSMYSIEFWG